MLSKSLIFTTLLVLVGFGHCNSPKGEGALVELDENNWSQILAGEWMVEL